MLTSLMRPSTHFRQQIELNKNVKLKIISATGKTVLYLNILYNIIICP